MLADLILDWICTLYRYTKFNRDDLILLDSYLVSLGAEGYNCAEYRQSKLSNPEDVWWSRQILCELMSLLVEAGADINKVGMLGCGYLEIVTRRSLMRPLWAREDLLYGLVKAGADVHAFDSRHGTISIRARCHGFWLLWCQALQDSGKVVEEVLREEGNDWLLEDDWEEKLLEHGYRSNWNYCLECELRYDYELDDELSGDAGENAGEGEDTIDEGHNDEEGDNIDDEDSEN